MTTIGAGSGAPRHGDARSFPPPAVVTTDHVVGTHVTAAAAGKSLLGTLGGVRRVGLLSVIGGLALVASACTSPGPGFREGAGSAPTTAPATTTAPAPTTATRATTAGDHPPVTPPAWTPCRGGAGPPGLECATIEVPLDYAKPGGRTIALALDRHPAGGPAGARIGSLLVNPGGPGVSGVDALDFEVALLSKAVLDSFDIIGFDPRGVARSAPIRCLDGPALDAYFHLDPAPTTMVGFDALVAAAKAFDQGCQSRSGDLLPFVSTENAARDMDQIRQAVGDPKLTYLGFSYGTLLGATYAELFPGRVRAMTLDGAVDPAIDPITFNVAQSAAFDKQLDAFFADCASRSSCAWKPGGDLRAAFDALMARIRARPLPGAGARTVGPGEAFIAVAWPLYDRASWGSLALALNRAGRGDGSVLLGFFDQYTRRGPDGSYSNQQDANSAINCLDAPWPTDPAVLLQDAPVAAKAAPAFGVADLYGGLSCAFWPVPPTGHPHAIRADGSPAIVVVGSTGDPATPYAQSQGLAGELAQGVLVTRVGDGHTGYRSSGCVRRAVDDYLVKLVVPANGTTCPTP